MDVCLLYIRVCADKSGVQLDAGMCFVLEGGLLKPEMRAEWLGDLGRALADQTNDSRDHNVEHDTTMMA